MMNFAIFVSGRGSNMAALLEACASGRILGQPRLVFSNKASAPALERAAAMGYSIASADPKTFATREDYDAHVVQILREHQINAVVLAGYMRIVTSTFLDAFPDAVINIHPALLPSFPGVDGVKKAWDYGVKVAGCTVHFVDPLVDHGPIIVQRALVVEQEWDDKQLAAEILALEHEALIDAVALFAAGRLQICGRRVRISQEL